MTDLSTCESGCIIYQRRPTRKSKGASKWRRQSEVHEGDGSDPHLSPGYLDEDCQYTLKTMKQMVLFDHGALISESTISRHLMDMLYTVRQVWTLTLSRTRAYIRECPDTISSQSFQNV
jgi:hypothetical protein